MTAKVSMMNFIGRFKKYMQNRKMCMIVLKLYRISWVVAMIQSHQNTSSMLLSLMLREIRQKGKSHVKRWNIRSLKR